MDDLSRLIQSKGNVRFCHRCGNRMSYSAVHGMFSCGNCGFTLKDTYGQMKELLEEEPNLSLAEISMILGVSIRQLRQYVHNGVLENPYMDQDL